MENWRNMLVRPETLLIDAIKIIDSGGGQIAIVADETQRLLGVVTDADIRKAILGGSNFQEPCSTIMTINPITLHVGTDEGEVLNLMRQRHIRQMPLVDDMGRVVDVALLMDIITHEPKLNPVVIMAGGLGKRLESITTNTPKPLLKVGSRPLLETILLQFIDQGFGRFYIAVNYKAHMIVDYFGDGSRWGVEINYLFEQERLGTAGALHMLPENIESDVLVINGDILTKVDFRKMLTMHSLAGAGMTVAVKDYTITVPYGVFQLDENRSIASFQEKPKHCYFVNAGIYVLSPKALKHVPEKQYFDMPSLFESLTRDNIKISAFPIREYWMDIGHPTDYTQANSDFDIHFAET